MHAFAPLSPNLVLLLILAIGGTLAISLGQLAARRLMGFTPFLPPALSLAQAAGMAGKFARDRDLPVARLAILEAGDEAAEAWFALSIAQHVTLRAKCFESGEIEHIQLRNGDGLQLGADSQSVWRSSHSEPAYTELSVKRADFRRYLNWLRAAQ